MGSAIFAKEILPVVEMTGFVAAAFFDFEAVREAANCYVLPRALGCAELWWNVVLPCARASRPESDRVEGEGEGKPQE